MRIGRKPIVILLAENNEDDRMLACNATAGHSLL